MLSKKNIQMMIRKGQPQKQRFGLRKLSIGVASVLLGLTFIGASSASADETVNQEGQAVQTELATPQPVEITGSESARQPDNDEVASSSTAEATPVSSEATSQVVADSAGAVQDQTPPSAQPVTSTAPEISGGGTVGSASDPASDIPQQNGVEIKFQDQDDHGNVLPDYVYIPGKKPGDKITMDEIIKHLPAGLEIVEGQPQEFEVTGEPYQSIPIYVRHIIEEKTESKDVEQIIYGHYGTNKEILNHQVVTFTRVVRYDKYTKQMVVVQEWQPSLTFQDYTVVPKDGFSANHSVIKETTVDSNSGTVKIDVLMKKNIVNTETDTVTRTIKLILPDGSIKYVRQTVTFTRQVTKKANGEIVYGEWDQPGKMFDDYYPAEIDGKKPDKTYIPREVANPDTKDYEVEVRYEAAYSTATEEKTVNRVIHLHHPNGTVETVNHTVTLTREVKTNLQTGEKEYGEWSTGQFAEFVVPTVEGHVPDIEKIELMEVNGTTEDQLHHVNYLAHQVDADTKTVNRLIQVTMPDGTVKTITQTVTFVKHTTKHPVNGEIISETEWQVVDGDGTWAEFIPEKVDGYTPSQEKVEAVTPNVNTGNVLVEISYKQNEKPTDPVGPSEPTEPDTPVDPDKPITPDKPDNPTEPDKPVSPGQPGTSDGPVDSDKPAGSDGPTSSGNSDQQGNENSASATTNAANAAATATVQLTSATTVEQADVKEVDNNAKKANQDNQQLPQTGEKQSPGLITGTMLVLVTLLLQLLTFGLVKKKQIGAGN